MNLPARFPRPLIVPIAVGGLAAALNVFMYVRLDQLSMDHPRALGVLWVLCFPGTAPVLLLPGSMHSLMTPLLLVTVSPLVTGAVWFAVAWLAISVVARVRRRRRNREAGRLAR